MKQRDEPKELTYQMPLSTYFFSSESELQEKLQTFGKRYGIPDGTVVKTNITEKNWTVFIRLNWETTA